MPQDSHLWGEKQKLGEDFWAISDPLMFIPSLVKHLKDLAQRRGIKLMNLSRKH